MFKIGDKVFINLKSEYKNQGCINGKRVVGEIIGNGSSDHPYQVSWEGKYNKNVYREKDLEFANQEPTYEIY